MSDDNTNFTVGLFAGLALTVCLIFIGVAIFGRNGDSYIAKPFDAHRYGLFDASGKPVTVYMYDETEYEQTGTVGNSIVLKKRGAK